MKLHGAAIRQKYAHNNIMNDELLAKIIDSLYLLRQVMAISNYHVSVKKTFSGVLHTYIIGHGFANDVCLIGVITLYSFSPSMHKM